MSRLRAAPAAGDDPRGRASGDVSTASDEALASALEDLEAGLSPLQVLQRYPEHEDMLAPLIQTAFELRTTRWPTMSMAGRVAGRERMHAALAEQKRRKAGFLTPLWRQVGVGLALTVMAGAALLASPFSPIDPRRRAAESTATQAAPIFVEPTTALSVDLPAPSPTPSATATALRTPRPSVSVEPSETVERLVLADPARVPTSTPKAQLTATRRPVRTTATSTVTATAPVSVTAVVTGENIGSAPATAAPATQLPSATVAMPTSTPSPVPPKPTATHTARPTMIPETPVSPTVQPPPTNTRQPSPTPQVSPTAPPSATPEPSKTERPHPRLTLTPDATRTPRRSDAADTPALLRVNDLQPRIDVRPPPLPPRAVGPRGRRP